MCTKENWVGFLRRNLYQCPQDVKEAAYKGLVRPILEYGICVCDPKGMVLQQEIEKVQSRAARFVTSNYCFVTGKNEDVSLSRKEGETVDWFFCTKI